MKTYLAVMAFILKILGPLAKILHVPADKLAHALVGIAFVWFGWATGWAFAGVLLATLAAFIKEWILDAEANWWDFGVTVVAALVAFAFTKLF